MAGDIITTGIHLSGGGAMIRGIDTRISEELGVKVTKAADPISAVVEGAGTLISSSEQYKEYRRNYMERETLV